MSNVNVCGSIVPNIGISPMYLMVCYQYTSSPKAPSSWKTSCVSTVNVCGASVKYIGLIAPPYPLLYKIHPQHYNIANLMCNK